MTVYLIHQTNSDLYKIGVSKHVRKRLKENQTGNGNELEIIITVPSEFAYQVETVIHRTWLHKKTIGEWFTLDKEDIEKFESLCFKIENNIKFVNEHNTWTQRGKQPF